MQKDQTNEEDERISRMLENVKNKLLVFSGKGGVGKSTVAANLALALSQKGLKVGLLDVDIHGPNQALMFGVEGEQVELDRERILPISITENLKLISMALFLEKTDTPVVWRGPLKIKAIKQFLADVAWGELDWLIFDSPPGTGDEPLTVAQVIPNASAIVVTTPQEVSLLDSRKAINFAQMLKLNVLGVVENMSGMMCPHCGEKIDLFRFGGGEKIATEYNVPLLGKIPMEPEIVETSDNGRPFMLNPSETGATKAMKEIADKIIK